MNEKIKTFARDHLITSEYTECGSQECHKYEFDEIELEKFAELIIQECIEQCYADYDSKEDWDKGVRWAVNQIKEHFGIEE